MKDLEDAFAPRRRHAVAAVADGEHDVLVRTRRVVSRRRARRNAVPTISSADSQSQRSVTTGTSRRASCSVLSVKRLSCAVSSTMLCARRRRRSIDSLSACSSSDDAAPMLVASGVR
jgi:hypothetical protein